MTASLMVQKVRLGVAAGASGAIAIVLFAAIFSVSLAAAQAKPQTTGRPTLEQDLAAITEFNRRYLKAINDGDIATNENDSLVGFEKSCFLSSPSCSS